jgi:hypothetical protein
MSELPFLEDALRSAARRRRLRRRRQPLLAASACVAALAVVLVLGSRDEERVAAPAPTRWTTTVRDGRDTWISLPADWQLARGTLTPHLSDPKELFSAATFPLRFVQGECNSQPDGALRRMTPADAFVTVQERRGGPPFPPRPAHFTTPPAGRFESCTRDRTDIQGFMIDFRDARRNFTALVWLGRTVSPERRAETFAILDRLRFR